MKKVLLMLLSLAVIGGPASADLVHRYEFNGDANDSIGTAHGTVGTHGIIEDGTLVTGRNAAGEWADIAAGANVQAGVALPLTAIEGITDNFTIEVWFYAVAPQGAYHCLYCLDDGTTTNHIIATPIRGGDQGWRSGIHAKQYNGEEAVVDGIMRGTPLDVWADNPDQGPRQMLLTYDGTAFHYYQNGELFSDPAEPLVVNTVEGTGFNLQDFVTQIDISAGAPYNDAMLKGAVHDFRIYNHALTEEEVAGMYSRGADATMGDIQSILSETASNPTPEDGLDMVGTVVGTTVTVDLGWNTAMDPANPEVVNAAIEKHYLYMTGDLTDPNAQQDLALIATLDADAPTATYTVSGLPLDGKYQWRVDEGILEGGSITGPEDPNTIEGPLWTFYSMPSMPVILTQPVRALKQVGDTYAMSIVVDSITTPVYTWYKSDDNEISEDDVVVGIDSDMLDFADIAVDDMAFYYCSVTNDSEIPVLSDIVHLEVESMIAYYSFDDTLENSVDGSLGVGVIEGIEEPVMSYDEGKFGNAIVFDGETEYVEIPCYVRNSYSIELWVKTEQTATDGNWWNGAGLVDGEMPGNVADYGTVLSGSGFAMGSGPSSTTIHSEKAINDGEWHYCVATRDIDNGVIAVYVDGQLENIAEDIDIDITHSEPDLLTIGKVRTGAGFFNGMIDEVKLYNYTLDEMTIAQTYVAMVPEASVCIQTLKPEIKFDLNEDCIVNVLDLAEIAGAWLDCAIYPTCFDVE